MRQLLITIAAFVLVGCGPSVPDISFHDAARDGNIEAVKQHLAAGADPDEENDTRRTPLFHAARLGHKEIVELLIAGGANVNAMLDVPITPLDYAIGSDHTEIANLLRKHGAKIGTALQASGN